jgi:hypothetical protein
VDVVVRLTTIAVRAGVFMQQNEIFGNNKKIIALE